MLRPAPPLTPSGDEGRSLLREELLKRQYHDQHLLQRLHDWLSRLFDRSVGSAAHHSPLVVIAFLLVGALIVVGLGLLVSRVRRDRRPRAARAGVLTDDRPSARDLRARAEAALAAGRLDDAYVDGFRALTARQVERGQLDDQPGATAHEVALHLGATFPAEQGRVAHAAHVFDATLYGDQPVSRDDADGVLALDDSLAGAR
jgi:hypothetical protein